jgi:hypothetical protein
MIRLGVEVVVVVGINRADTSLADRVGHHGVLMTGLNSICDITVVILAVCKGSGKLKNVKT